jgi:hypothetical protein
VNVSRLILSFALSVCTFACGRFELFPAKPSPTDSRLEQLQTKRDAKRARLAEISDPVTGWPSATDCDGLLWAGLACAAGVPVAIELAEYPEGVWNRRPSPACWNPEQGDVGSKSTVSNDMVLGKFWCRWRQGDAAAVESLQRFADNAEARDWVVGEPITEASRVILKPNQIGMLGRMLYAQTNGRDDRYWRRLFTAYAHVDADFERHLQALGIALQGEIFAAVDAKSLDATVANFKLLDINGEMHDRLIELEIAEPENYLYAAVLGVYRGDMTRAIDLLLADGAPASYVRGNNAEAFALVEWLFVENLVRRRQS